MLQAWSNGSAVRAPAALPEDLGPCGSSKLSVTPGWGSGTLADTHADKMPMHRKISKSFTTVLLYNAIDEPMRT